MADYELIETRSDLDTLAHDLLGEKVIAVDTEADSFYHYFDKTCLAAPANQPFPATFKWIAALPREVRPLELLKQYPRIANMLAQAWHDPSAFREYMFDLLIDRRGGRQGFPQAVRSELLRLRTYFDHIHPHIPTVGRHAAE